MWNKLFFFSNFLYLSGESISEIATHASAMVKACTNLELNLNLTYERKSISKRDELLWRVDSTHKKYQSMKHVLINNPKNDDLVQQFGMLYSVLKDSKFGDEINFDLSNTHWLCPIIILPIAAYIVKTGSVYVKSQDQTVNNYLNNISFPKGINSATEFGRVTQVTKTYVPISVLERDKGSERENLESMFSELVYKLLGSIPGAKNVVYYPIAELVTNIFEHSKGTVGFVFGQYYPSKEYLDICIVDTGRGLARAYKEEMNLDLTDGESIEEVLKGHSTKSQVERGYGIAKNSYPCRIFTGRAWLSLTEYPSLRAALTLAVFWSKVPSLLYCIYMDSTTNNTISIVQTIAPIVSSRDLVRNLEKVIAKVKADLVDLDFINVEFISRSAAHEMIMLQERMRIKRFKKKDVRFTNTNDEVKKMLRIVAANKAMPEAPKPKIQLEKISIQSLLEAAS